MTFPVQGFRGLGFRVSGLGFVGEVLGFEVLSFAGLGVGWGLGLEGARKGDGLVGFANKGGLSVSWGRHLCQDLGGLTLQ